MDTIFYIEKDDVMRALKFAEEATLGKSQSKRDFGSGLMRTQEDQIADIAEGKIAEMGFNKFLKENFKIETAVDLNHYVDIKSTDLGNDLELLTNQYGEVRTGTFKVDVKTTKPFSKWLLIESHKFWANAYVLIKTALPRGCEQDPYSCIKDRIQVEIVGFAYYTDFIDPATKKHWIEYSRGDYLINPDDLDVSNPVKIKDLTGDPTYRRMGVPLKSNINYGLPVSVLRNTSGEWEALLYKIKSSTIQSDDCIISRMW